LGSKFINSSLSDLERKSDEKFEPAQEDQDALRQTALSDASRNAPATAPQMLAASQFSGSEPRQAVIAGDPQQQATRLLAHSILRDFHPDLVVLYAKDGNSLSGDAAEALAAMRSIQGRPALHLCENFTCRAPVTSPEDARRLLDRIREKSLD
jgi:uncharacterized protein